MKVNEQDFWVSLLSVKSFASKAKGFFGSTSLASFEWMFSDAKQEKSIKCVRLVVTFSIQIFDKIMSGLIKIIESQRAFQVRQCIEYEQVEVG